MPASRLRVLLGALSGLLLTGCGGLQSALDPAGREAERLADVFWLMAVGAAIIWLATISLALYAARHDIDISNTALYWRFTALTAVIAVGVIAGFPPAA